MASFPLVGIILNLTDGAGNPLTSGSAVFTPTAPVSGTDGIEEIVPGPVTVRLDSSAFPVAASLFPTDIAAMPSWAWQVSFTGVGLDSFSFQAPAGPVSFTGASGTPGAITWTASAAVTRLPPGTGVKPSGGSLPAGLTAGTTYYVVSPAGQTLSLSATPGGSPLAFTGSGTGTLTVASYYLAGLAPVSTSTGFSRFVFAPGANGTAGQVLTATGTGGATGWADPATGAVASVFGRTGTVVPASGDYTAAQVTGAVQVGGDIGGTAAAPTVAKIQGTAIAAPSGGTTNFLRADGSWAPPGGTGLPVPSGTAHAGDVPAATGTGPSSAWLPGPGLPPSGDTTGVTDTAAIQALVNLGVRRVTLQAGLFTVKGDGNPQDGCVMLGSTSAGNTELAGQGTGVSTLQLAAAATAGVTGIVRTKSATANTKITVRDLTLDGNGSTIASPSATRIVGFFCGTSPDSGPGLTDTDIKLLNVEVMNCTGYGFDPHERTTRITFDGCVSHDNGYGSQPYDGFTLDGCYNATVVNCRAYNNSRYGINLVTASANCVITGNQVTGNGTGGIALENGAKNNVVCGNFVSGNGLATGGDGIFLSGRPNAATPIIDATAGADNLVTGNMVTGNGGNGIHVYGESRAHITGNIIRDSSQTTTATYSQILLDDDSSTSPTLSPGGCVVTGNDMDVTGVANIPGYGLRENTAAGGPNFVTGNRSNGASVSDILLSAATSLALAAHNEGGGSTHGGFTLPDGQNIAAGTSTGSQFGTSVSQKIGFYGAAPLAQQAATADLGTVLSNLGLRAVGGAYPLTTTGLIQANGALKLAFTARTAGATLTAGTSAELETVDATSGAITMNLAATTTGGYRFTVKKTDSSANAVTVNAGAGGLIDGAQTFVLSTQFKYVTVLSTNTSGVWYVVAAG